MLKTRNDTVIIVVMFTQQLIHYQLLFLGTIYDAKEKKIKYLTILLKKEQS